MPNRRNKRSDWMPVFVLHEPMETVFSTGPRRGRSRSGEAWQRIGTAVARADGGWDVKVNAVPLDGRLVIRPARRGEERNAVPGLWR